MQALKIRIPLWRRRESHFLRYHTDRDAISASYPRREGFRHWVFECVCDKSCRLRVGIYPAKGLDCTSSGATVGNPKSPRSLSRLINPRDSVPQCIKSTYLLLELYRLQVDINELQEGFCDFVIRLEKYGENETREEYCCSNFIKKSC